MSQTACERGLSPQSARKPLALAHPINLRESPSAITGPIASTVSSRSRSELPISKLTGDLTRD